MLRNNFLMNTPRLIDIKQPGFKSFDLKQEILNGLQLKSGNRFISTLALYDDLGLQLFDKVTYAPEYYLTQSEIHVLNVNMDEIIQMIPDHSAIIELGSGSLRKTKLILDKVNQTRVQMDYYALDLMEQELKTSLLSLGTYENIQTHGLWGTYDDGLDYLVTFPKDTVKTILWMGSSIGNLTREEAKEFMKKLQSKLNPGDRILVGIDLRKSKERITLAYDDPQGINRNFIMNALVHSNRALGTQIFDVTKFDYVNTVDEVTGIRRGGYVVLEDHTVSYGDDEFQFIKGENIGLVCSIKYSPEEISELGRQANLITSGFWSDGSYTMNCFIKPWLSFSPSQEEFPTVEEWNEVLSAWIWLSKLDELNPIIVEALYKLNETLTPSAIPSGFNFNEIRKLITSQISNLDGESNITMFDENVHYLESAVTSILQKGLIENWVNLPVVTDELIPKVNLIDMTQFQLESRPVTNGDYLSFLKITTSKDHPLLWVPSDTEPFQFRIRTLSGLIPLDRIVNCPVYVSYSQAMTYASWCQRRLPTTSELTLSLPYFQSHSTRPVAYNTGLRHYHPLPVTPTQLFGDGWEWCSNDSNPFPPQPPTLLGGSFLTHPRRIHPIPRSQLDSPSHPILATFRCATHPLR